MDTIINTLQLAATVTGIGFFFAMGLDIYSRIFHKDDFKE